MNPEINFLKISDSENNKENKDNNDICDLCEKINTFLINNHKKENEQDGDFRSLTILFKNIIDGILLAIFDETLKCPEFPNKMLISDFKYKVRLSSFL